MYAYTTLVDNHEVHGLIVGGRNVSRFDFVYFCFEWKIQSVELHQVMLKVYLGGGGGLGMGGEGVGGDGGRGDGGGGDGGSGGGEGGGGDGKGGGGGGLGGYGLGLGGLGLGDAARQGISAFS